MRGGPYYEYEPEKTKNEEQLGDFVVLEQKDGLHNPYE